MTAEVFCMYVETATGVKQHGYHLGTDLRTAESFVFESLRKPGVLSVRLDQGRKTVRLYDDRDLASA